MKIKFPWRNKKETIGLAFVESRLDKHYKSVSPRREFTQDLRNQLVGVEDKRILGIKPKTMRIGLIAVGAGMSLFLVLLTSIRVFISLLSALGLLHQVNKQIKDKKASPQNLSLG